MSQIGCTVRTAQTELAHPTRHRRHTTNEENDIPRCVPRSYTPRRPLEPRVCFMFIYRKSHSRSPTVAPFPPRARYTVSNSWLACLPAVN